MRLNPILARLFPIALAVLSFCLLLVVLLPIHRNLAQPATQLMKFALAQGSTHFAIADFDGDLRPDLAMIRVSRYGVPQTEYSLELRFSTGVRPAIGLIGPSGGLEVFPQDVNGDQITDLVITSVMDAEFVAILVNDGNGNFTQVDRANYPSIGKRADSRLLAPADSANYQFALIQSNPFGGEALLTGWPCHQQNSFAFLQTAAPVLQDSAARWESGRAPPAV